MIKTNEAYNRRMKRKERVDIKLKELTGKLFEDNNFDKKIMGFDAKFIGEHLGINRNNTSKELNELFREDKVVKIIGKPVRYLNKVVLETVLGNNIKVGVFKSDNQLLKTINEKKEGDNTNTENDVVNTKKKHVITTKIPEKNISDSENDVEFNNHKLHGVLEDFIGSDESLKKQIDDGKAAILYPPSGLHMLITGSTGVGKSKMAETLYKYAIEAGVYDKSSPFVIFNCADYSDNQQLLVSQLFGYLRGAFTGAEKEKTGLVDKANNGILFLDEVHRLSSEGQEMLFTLMDKGLYRRLGETESNRHAQVLIIAATTEDPSSVMLQTFLRRIPVIIRLPDLEERSLKERMSFINRFYIEEAIRIGLPIKVSREVLKAFLLYDCPGNVGQLKSDIQLICARAFLDYMTLRRNQVEIKTSHLLDTISRGLLNVKEKRSELLKYFDFWTDDDVIFDNKSGYTQSASINFKNDVDNIGENLYKLISMSWKQMDTDNKSDSEKRKIIDLKIQKYFHELVDGVKLNSKKSDEAIIKVIDERIFEAVKDSINQLGKKYASQFDNKHIYGLALHVNNLVKRISSGQTIKYYGQDISLSEYPEELSVAKNLKTNIERKLLIDIPDSELTFITMFFHAIKAGFKQQEVGVLVISHGESVASSMVQVANTLLVTNHAKAIDMPLDGDIQNALSRSVDIIKGIDKGKGVLILVDMGSVSNFGKIITKETGIETKTIDMVSTAMVIEATRKSMINDMNLEKLYDEVVGAVYNSRQKQNEYQDYKNLINNTEDLDYFRKSLIDISSKIITFINPTKACLVLYDVLDEILGELNKQSDTNINTKFIFHCICMLERVIKKTPYPYQPQELKVMKKTHPRIFKLIKKKFKTVNEIFAISIPDNEIAYIVEMFYMYFDTDQYECI